MMNVILAEGLQNREFIAERTENFEELVEVVSKYTPEMVAEICGVNAEDLKKAARMYATAEKASIFYSMGVTQHSTGVSGVMGTSNLALLCGHLGKESSGVNPLRGQNNVQGACDMGCLPGDLPGYQKTANPDVIAKFEKAWGVKLSDKPGLTVTEIVGKAGKGDIKVLYIMGENPMLSDPDLNHVKEALENTEFLVVQDIFLTETAQLADVVLPAASFAEKDGTFTNTERRVQRVRKAVDAPGKAKPDWEILMEVMKRLGYDKKYGNAAEIMDEAASVTPQYGGISHARLENEGGLQWPCPNEEHPGTGFLHKDRFAKGLGTFFAIDHKDPAEMPDAEYPLYLTTGRLLYQYHSGTMSRRAAGLTEKAPECLVELAAADAAKYGIAAGDQVKIRTRRGEITARANISTKASPGTVFIPFHFAEASANKLTNAALDPVSKIPEYKVCAVQIEKA